jgi:antitoxin component of MazEF toxin-antitoxin module
MTKTLQKYGNSHALVLDKALMDAAGIKPETPLIIGVQGGCITIRASNVGIGPERVAASIAKLRPEYDEMLKNLAK